LYEIFKDRVLVLKSSQEFRLDMWSLPLRERDVGTTQHTWFAPNRASARFSCNVMEFLESSLPRPAERMQRTGFMASAIARPHTCQLIPVVTSEEHSLLEEF
jgi:hypothetical protein